MTDIKELAQQEGDVETDSHGRVTYSFDECRLERLTQHFLAAYLAEQEPVAYLIRQYGRSKLVWANHQMTRSENDGMVFDALFTAPHEGGGWEAAYSADQLREAQVKVLREAAKNAPSAWVESVDKYLRRMADEIERSKT